MDVSAAGGAPRVLIAEDDAQLRRLLELRLSVDGYATRAAADGVAAFSELAIWMPDVVLSDVMMPRMSGLSLCRAIRGEPRTAALPIILLTARLFDDDIQAVLELGAITFMSKPFDARSLDEALRSALHRRAAPNLQDVPGPAA